MTENFEPGQELWHDLHGLVVLVYVSGGYAYVRDEDNNSYAVPEDELSSDIPPQTLI